VTHWSDKSLPLMPRECAGPLRSASPDTRISFSRRRVTSVLFWSDTACDANEQSAFQVNGANGVGRV
jgi:hypothetical protein